MPPDGPKLSLTVLAAIGLAACNDGKLGPCLDFPPETDTDTDVDSPCLDLPVETDTDVDSPCLDFPVDSGDTELDTEVIDTDDTDAVDTDDTDPIDTDTDPIDTDTDIDSPCLDFPVDTGDSEVLGPCLSPPLPNALGPALGTAPADFSWTPDAGVLRGVLDETLGRRVLPEAPDPARRFGACLDVAATGWWPADRCAPADVSADGLPALTPRGEAISRVLESGALPDDVARLLRDRR